ncbi:MAG: BatD family protein [Rikenellaceae bacterium]
MKKYIFLLSALLLSVCGLMAQEVSYRLDAPMSVSQGERFRVALVLTNGDGTDFSAPTFTNASILAGPSIANGTNYSNINGVSSTTTTRTYTYVLEATGGNVLVGASSVKVDGKSYRTNASTIEVSDAPSSGSNNNSGANRSGGGNAMRPSGAGSMEADDIVLKMKVTKSNVYKGEALCATLCVYTRVGISGLESAKYADFSGFWTQELDISKEQATRETLNDKVYEVHPIRRWLLYPQRTGRLTIEASSFTAIAQVVTRASGNSLFDEFFGGGTNIERVPKNIASAPVTINVEPTPTPAPASFDGAVGQFTLESSISNDLLAANSAGSITLKLSGTGNFPLITQPSVDMPVGIERYDTKSSEKIENTTSGSRGSRTWEFPFVTRAEGSYVIPSIDITYFDPTSKSYKTLSSGAGGFPLEVTRDESGSSSSGGGGAFVSGVTRENLKVLGRDIRFIKVSDPALRTTDGLLIFSVYFWLIVLLLLVLFFILRSVLSKYIASRMDVALTKNKKANKVALRRLRRARGYMQSDSPEAFFEEMLRALWGYVADKLSIEVSELTKERVRVELSERGVSSDQSDLFLELIGQCEMAQYAPSVAVPMRQAYEQALEVIGAMELK